MIRVVLFIYLLHFVSSQTVPVIIDSSPPLLEKNVNETVELSCKVKDLDGASITWGKRTGDLQSTLSFNGIKGTTDKRISARFENTSSTATSFLRIDSLQAENAGVYRCVVGDSIYKDVTLQIRSPPFVYGNTSSTLNTSLNSSVTFECYGGGYPAPEVIWTRENNAVLPNGETSYRGNVLKINNTQKDHAGVYYCVVDNKVGNSAKKNYRLVVEYAPIVKARQNRVDQAIGFEARLECIVESSDTPTISWLRDNIPIHDNQYYSQPKSALEGSQTTALLIVKVVEKNVYGTYTCAAYNRVGKNSATIDLRYSDKEVCSQNCSTSSGHSIISMLELKLSFTGVIIFMLNWQNM